MDINMKLKSIDEKKALVEIRHNGWIYEGIVEVKEEEDRDAETN